MKLSLERKVAVGFGAALLVLIVVTVAEVWNVKRFQGAYAWMRQSYHTLVRLDRVITEMLAMEAAVRGYALLGDEATLRPYTAGAQRFEEAMGELRGYVAENPRQQTLFAELNLLAERARRTMADRIASRQSGTSPAQRADYVAGERAVGEFWRVVREMGAEERRQLDERLKGTHRLGQITLLTAVAASVIAAICVVFAALQTRRELGQRRKAEAALQESFARVEDLYHHAPCGYHSLDASGTFLEINDTALRWLGYSRAEVVGRMKFSDVLSPESAAQFAERFPHFQRSGSVQNVEYEWQRKDGSRLHVLLNATAIYGADGSYVASRATVFDVSDRKRAEAERDRFFTLSYDLLCVANFEGYFLRLNPAWERVLGYTSDELRARPAVEFVHPDDRPRTASEMARLTAGEEVSVFENRYRRKDGTYRWLRWSSRAVGSEQRIYASARDVTESKEAADRIEKLNADLASRAAQLENANAELESFSYSVSHDLRAPLRHINGFASLLGSRAGNSLDDESRRYVATITKSAKQMGVLIDDLLAFSRVGRATLRRELVNQEQLVRTVLSDGRYNTDERRIEWDIGPLPNVRADAAMLRQVWANLIDNAVKYSSKVAEPRIAIGGREDTTTREHVFFIRDNGVGFDMAYADKLFGVFQRLHSATEFEGTGIGLANVRRIIARHGGRTWAEGRVGEGAVFYFSIPIGPAPALPPQ